jgi:ribosome-associated protein
MNPGELRYRNFENEFVYSTSRSGGPGGQNVNKVSTKVELRFSLNTTSLLSESEKELIFVKLKNRINNEGELLLVSQSERTQLLNKKAVTNRFYELVSKALTRPVKRRVTKPTAKSTRQRLDEKKNRGIIKKLRKDSGRSSDDS